AFIVNGHRSESTLAPVHLAHERDTCGLKTQISANTFAVSVLRSKVALQMLRFSRLKSAPRSAPRRRCLSRGLSRGIRGVVADLGGVGAVVGDPQLAGYHVPRYDRAADVLAEMHLRLVLVELAAADQHR